MPKRIASDALAHPLLVANAISKTYDRTQALRSVSFELHAGEVHALVGENGAGKSTLIKVMTGAITPDSGTLEIDGQLVLQNSPRISRALGVAAIYQQPSLFPLCFAKTQNGPKISLSLAIIQNGPTNFLSRVVQTE